jgi:hypothetical protein
MQSPVAYQILYSDHTTSTTSTAPHNPSFGYDIYTWAMNNAIQMRVGPATILATLGLGMM